MDCTEQTPPNYSPKDGIHTDPAGTGRLIPSSQTANGGERSVLGGVLANPCFQQEAVFSCGDQQAFDFLF